MIDPKDFGPVSIVFSSTAGPGRGHDGQYRLPDGPAGNYQIDPLWCTTRAPAGPLNIALTPLPIPCKQCDKEEKTPAPARANNVTKRKIPPFPSLPGPRVFDDPEHGRPSRNNRHPATQTRDFVTNQLSPADCHGRPSTLAHVFRTKLVYGHITLNTPVLVRSLKLSKVELC